MTLFVVEDFDDAFLEAKKYEVVYRSDSGRLGFECDINNEKAMSLLKLPQAHYLSIDEGIIDECDKSNLLLRIRKDLSGGAFIFISPDELFYEEINAFNEYQKKLRKHKMLERYKKATGNEPLAPSLKSFYLNNNFDNRAFVTLVSNCLCCFQARYSDYGISFLLYFDKNIDLSSFFLEKPQFLKDRSEIRCW